MINILIKNIGVNTRTCFDMDGSQEFKCECNDSFDGKRCEIFNCPLNCENNGLCKAEIDEFGNKNWECECSYPFQG